MSSVTLNPSSTLGFNRPLTQLVKKSLSITNPNAQPVAFKVKTTAPKLYCVRPNSGRVEPDETVEVSVMLQAMKEEPPLSAKCKDKFLIQSTAITPDKETMPLHDLWNATEDNTVAQQKLKVAYLPPIGQSVPEEDETMLNQSSMAHGEESRYDTVREHPNGSANGTAEPAEDLANREVHILPIDNPARPASPPGDFSNAHEEHPEEILVAAPGPVIPEVAEIPPVEKAVDEVPEPAAPEPAAAPAQDEELLAKYAAAQIEIERLRALLAAVPDPSSVESSAPGLRRRTNALSDDGASTVAPTEAGTYLEDAALQQPEGVPLQVVVIIALGVFITTYLFF